MSEYNDLFDFSAPQLGFDAVDSEYPTLAPDLDQSAAWTVPPQPSVGLMGGDTAAELQLDLDSAPSMGVGPVGRPGGVHWRVEAVSNHSCAVCFEPYQTDTALHKHAVEAQHQAYRCDKCGTGFNKHSALKRHIDTQHARNIFACVLCDNKFTRKDKLKDHWHHFHKVSLEGLRFLSDSQDLKPRKGAPSRRRRAPARKAAASSGTSAPSLPPGLVAGTAGPSDWSFAASAGQQYAGLPAGSFVPGGAITTASPSIPASSSVSAGLSSPSVDPFAAAPVLTQDYSTTFDDFFRDENWAAGFNGFNF